VIHHSEAKIETSGRDEAPDQADEVKQSAATIGIAISGGGVRAALYSLGVLVYLVHSGLHDRVRIISSVSGGSIVNAILGLSKDGRFSQWKHAFRQVR
jgi:NTE family protein